MRLKRLGAYVLLLGGFTAFFESLFIGIAIIILGAYLYKKGGSKTIG